MQQGTISQKILFSKQIRFFSLSSKNRANPRFTTVAEDETTQNWTNDELVGIRSDLRKSFFPSRFFRMRPLTFLFS